MKIISLSILFSILLTGVSHSQPESGDLVRQVAIKWNFGIVGKNQNWFQDDLVAWPTNQPRPVKHTVQYSCPAKTKVVIVFEYNNIEKLTFLNEGKDIKANVLYKEPIIVFNKMKYNLQHTKGSQNCTAIICESYHNVDM